MKTGFFVPRKGLLLRDPITHKTVPAEGAKKPLARYWWRRVADGDGHWVDAEQPSEEQQDSTEEQPDLTEESE